MALPGSYTSGAIQPSVMRMRVSFDPGPHMPGLSRCPSTSQSPRRVRGWEGRCSTRYSGYWPTEASSTLSPGPHCPTPPASPCSNPVDPDPAEGSEKWDSSWARGTTWAGGSAGFRQPPFRRPSSRRNRSSFQRSLRCRPFGKGHNDLASRCHALQLSFDRGQLLVATLDLRAREPLVSRQEPIASRTEQHDRDRDRRVVEGRARDG
jgi:hypothetical protein